MQERLSFLCAALLLNEIYPPTQVAISNTFWDKLRTKMTEGGTDGRRPFLYPPRHLLAGDDKVNDPRAFVEDQKVMLQAK
jgi:hypothetical protein